MALEVPLAGFRVGALEALLPPDQQSLLHPPGDTLGLAVTTAGLLEDPAGRSRIGADARRSALRVCDPGRCAESHVRAFEIALAHRTVRVRARASTAAYPAGRCLERFNRMPQKYADRAGRAERQDGRGRGHKTRKNAEAEERA